MMKRTFDRGPASSTNNNGVVMHNSNRRSTVSFFTLQNMLAAGIFAFVISIIITYSHLMKIEPNHAIRHIVNSVTVAGSMPNDQSLPPDQDSSHLQKNNNIHLNPGRARGSQIGKVKCDEDISRLVSYWNDPRSDVDRDFVSPFLESPSAYNLKRPKKTRYLSFEPDLGGWNNIRMEFEIMVVLAAATGRTLVLPPDNPLYLLNREKENKHRGIQKFFQPFDDVVETISTEEFFQKEIIGQTRYPLPTDEKNRTRLMGSLQQCYWMKKHTHSCIFLYEYLSQVADFVPNWHGEHHCLIMDDNNWFKDDAIGVTGNEAQRQQIKRFCAKRTPIYYNTQMHDSPLIHFHSHHKDTRLLVHYYAFIYFTNPKVGNYFKRLVRDRVRYSDEIFCAAGKIVKSLIEESVPAGYFSMHIRRGDFQWPKMRISAEEWYENTRHWLKPDDQHLLYIATDETNRTWFEPLMKHYRVSFLNDYSELADLPNLDPNFVGMIDQVVASRASSFVGTYFSSFSAYIGRMRGYHSVSGKRMFYSHPDYWNETHIWVYPHSSYSAREFPLGWAGIDKDGEPSEQDFY